MKSIILCEGSTDYVLLQYFMRKVYGWVDSGKTGERPVGKNIKCIRTMEKKGNKLSIASCGGVSNILPGFNYIVEYNNISAETESYDKIVILTDRDEIDTEAEFSSEVKRILDDRKVRISEVVCHNKWLTCTYKNGHGKEYQFELLILIIPFEETGAMETFLLNAISENNIYDAGIINDCNLFVDNIDTEKRYLTKRRYITKAKFDVYFSIRTAAEQFVERQNILRNVDWENYAALQKNFDKLKDL